MLRNWRRIFTRRLAPNMRFAGRCQSYFSLKATVTSWESSLEKGTSSSSSSWRHDLGRVQLNESRVATNTLQGQESCPLHCA